MKLCSAERPFSSLREKEGAQYMRKIAAIILTGILSVSLAGCSLNRDVWMETGSAGTEVSGGTKGSEKEAVSNPGKEDSAEEKESKKDADGTRTADFEQGFYVYICGQVNRPGVYEVKEQARIYQLVEQAGGLTKEADLSAVNQAQILTDGQMVYIPAKGESFPADESTGNGTGTGSASMGKVNINTAGVDQLTTLTGIGEGKAQSIIAYREEQGGFQSIEEIMNVEGIKEGTYQKIKDQIMV